MHKNKVLERQLNQISTQYFLPQKLYRVTHTHIPYTIKAKQLIMYTV